MIIRSGVVGNKEQPICHSPPPSDNDAEINFFVKNHIPPGMLRRKRRRKIIKRIPDELGKNNFRKLIQLRKSFKDPNKVITRTERKEANELRRKINLYMTTPSERDVLERLKKVRWFFIKRKFKYFKRKHTNRIEWRTMPVYSLKKNSPFTHDEIVVMCVGSGTLHYIGKLTRKEILLLTETAEEYHKNGLLNVDKDKVYILGTVIPFIKAAISFHLSVKMKVLNSKKYGKTFRNRFEYLFRHRKETMKKAILRDKNIDINCEHGKCYEKKVHWKGWYKSDPFTFINHLANQLTKIEQLADVAVRVATIRHRIIKNFRFKMWEYRKFGRSFFPYVPTRDLAKLKTTPGNLYFNTNNTPYGVPHTAPISFYRVVQYAIAGHRLERQCCHRLWHSNDLLMVVRRLQKYTPLNKAKFMGALCAEVVNKSIAHIVKYKNAFRKIAKVNKSIQEKRKLRLRAKRLGRKYTLFARTVNSTLQVRLTNHPGFRKDLMAYIQRISIMRSIFSTTRTVKSKKNGGSKDPSCDEETASPMMFYRNSIETLQQNPRNFHAAQDAIIRRYKTLINELKEIQLLMKPQTLAKKKKKKKRKCYIMIRSIYKNVKLGKINSHRISKSMNVWQQFDAHIRNLMDDFTDYIENLVDSKMSHWPPKDDPPPYSNLFDFEKPKTVPKPVMNLNECTYNKKLRVLVNNKKKKILGGYRSLKLGTDWTSKYHEIIQRKFIKVEHFHQQKDSYVIQAGKMAAKGCEKVVKKCFYALRLFGFQKKDLELALLIYAKLRIMVKMEPTVRYPCKDKLLEANMFLDTKYKIYTEAIGQHRENISKITPQFISWRRQDNNFMNKVLVENCVNPKHSIEKFFHGLDLRHTKSRKFLAKNELFDLNDYKYYDYKSDDDFSNKLDYSSDSSCDKNVFMIDCCLYEREEVPHMDKNSNDQHLSGRRISKVIDLKELINPDSTADNRDEMISIIQNHHNSLRESQSEWVKDENIEFCPDLYINTNNLHRNGRRHVLKHIKQSEQDKLSHNIIVSTDNDSSSTSYDTKFRKSYFQDKENLRKCVPDIIESDLRIQSRRKEMREKFSLRLQLGDEFRWKKTHSKLEDTFEKFLNFKLSHLKFECQDYKKHFVPEYRPIYYLRNLPVIKESEDTPLLFGTVANFRKELFEKFEGKSDPHMRRETEDIDKGSTGSDSNDSINLTHLEGEESIDKLKSDFLFDCEKLFSTKYDDTYQNLKGYDYLKLKEEIRNEIENFKQLLRYEKECLVQNAHSNDVLMEIAERAESGHPTEESLLSKREFIDEGPLNSHKRYTYDFDPDEWQQYIDWINTNVSY